jgi:hypothetical protein
MGHLLGLDRPTSPFEFFDQPIYHLGVGFAANRTRAKGKLRLYIFEGALSIELSRGRGGTRNEQDEEKKRGEGARGHWMIS